MYLRPRDDREIANRVSYNAYRSSINLATRFKMTLTISAMVGLSKNETLVARNIFPTNFLNRGFDKKKRPVLTDLMLKTINLIVTEYVW